MSPGRRRGLPRPPRFTYPPVRLEARRILAMRGWIRRFAGWMGVDRRHALCIGDEVRDAEAARGEGLRFGAVTWGYTRADVLARAKPDYLFRRVDDIAPALLDRQAPRA